MKKTYLVAALAGTASVLALSATASAEDFNIPGGDLKTALNTFARQARVALVYPVDELNNVQTRGVVGDLTPEAALGRVLMGTGFSAHRTAYGSVAVTHEDANPSRAGTPSRIGHAEPIRLAATHAAASVETVVVTSSKIKGDIQTVPIAITALSQEQLTSRQIAGGPDLVKEVPNLTFTKTNFTGYSISIRGIGTQAISVATDPAVAVALNDMPFIRNHFFEQEFYDVNQVEVVRGPQGTLYGRNATAGVVNVISAKPTDQFEAMLSADWGNFTNRRYEGMVNIPIDADQLDLRVAGEWTKRDGYTTNGITGDPVDGRDLWSTRVTVGWHPLQDVQAYLVWEHFQESDDRMRTQKQLCKTDPGLSNVLGIHVYDPGYLFQDGTREAFDLTTGYLSQGCLPASLYAPESFGVPYGYSLPYVVAGWVSQAMRVANPYASTTQSSNLRVIETQIDPKYIAKNDTVEFNVDYNVSPSLTFSSQTGYNADFLWSTEDYNRFNTTPDLFVDQGFYTHGVRGGTLIQPDGNYACKDGAVVGAASDCAAHGGTLFAQPTGYFCDPQLGCSTRLVVQDISREHAWQFNQEFRLASNFKGPFNFSIGANYMHYETVEDYFVFSNALTLMAATSKGGSLFTTPWVPGVTDNSECFENGSAPLYGGHWYQYNNPGYGAGIPSQTCYYIDPNDLEHVNSLGHNYFLSRNPYVLNSYAGFGEAYYNILPDLKLTSGLRWTSDHKHFIDIPSELLSVGYGYMPYSPSGSPAIAQQWNQWTGRFAANWSPKLDFTDQTLIYGSFAHGYKAGGANPPGATIYAYGGKAFGAGITGVPVHPLTFKPEFIDAYELGTKNTLADGGITLNGDVFFYNYKGYQISKIVDRTAINDNFDATVRGAEIEAMYEPLPGLKFNFAGGYEDTRINNGQSSIDLMDRTAGHPGWMVMKAFVTQPSNCIFPDYVVAGLIEDGQQGSYGNYGVSACGDYGKPSIDPVTQGYYHWNNGNPYYVTPDTNTGQEPPLGAHIFYPVTTLGGFTYPGFDPRAGNDPNDPYAGQNTYNGFDYGPVPNNGEGFAKPLGGNELPNAPHFTVSLSGEYTIPVSEDWAATLHSDFYWQSQSFARVFNDRPYDKIRGYSNVNLALILTSASGWQVIGYLKNVFDTTAITGTFLNSDDSGLTTNIFLTDPRLFGVRVTKNW